jgi:cysteine-rich repeat protein
MRKVFGVLGRSTFASLVVGLLASWTFAGALHADPLIVISITGGSAQIICDTLNPLDCVTVTQSDLLLCKPTQTGGGGEITGCDWSVFFDGDLIPGAQDDPEEIDQQMRGLLIAPNGNLVFSVAGNDSVGGVDLKDKDLGLFVPTDVLAPYVNGNAYESATGAFKLYLDGELAQEQEAGKEWDAIDILADGTCEDAITTADNPYSCPIMGSLTAGNTDPGKFDGVFFRNEDLIRCIPTDFAGNGAVEGCDWAVMLDSSAVGIPSDIEAIDVLNLDNATMTTQFVFMKKSGDLGIGDEPGRDLILYDGSVGSGECVGSGNPCASSVDCPKEACPAGSCVPSGGGCTTSADCPIEACDTGSCTQAPFGPCATDEECTGAGNSCDHQRDYSAAFSLFFDGSAVGLTGSGQKLEGFSIVPDDDGDQVPDGADNCPTVDNPPSVCNDPAETACPSGLSSECPMGFICTQPDGDGDGTGDACDLCDGRPDTGPNACECGDGILDIPTDEAQANNLFNEQCDLGDANDPAGPCTDDCKILGECTGSMAACSLTMPCPMGEGCCGDGVVEGPEECDDGNTIEDDECDSDCQDVVTGVEIVGCDDLVGPNVVPAFVKLTKFKDTGTTGIDRWKTKGDFNLADGMVLDPSLDPSDLNQPVTIIYNNALGGVLFQHTLPPGNFDFKVNKPSVKKYLFKDPEADVPAAGSWRKGKLIHKANKVKFVLDGRGTPENGITNLFLVGMLDSPVTVRQTIRIGDICATRLLVPPECEVKGGGKTVKCKP